MNVNYNEDDQLDYEQPAGGSAPAPKGSVHLGLTLLSLVMVAGLSFLMCYLTREVENRPFWMMGLIFMAPAGAMFISALILDFMTDSMTPGYNRGGQVKVALVATLLTFAVGCLFDGVYLLGGYARVAQPNVMLVLDHSGSMYEDYTIGGRTVRFDNEVQGVVRELVGNAEETVQVGAVAFDHEVRDKVPMAPMTSAQRTAILNLSVNHPASPGATLFYEPLMVAIEEISSKRISNARIVLLTDGVEGGGNIDPKKLLSRGSNVQTVLDLCTANGISVYCVGFHTAVSPELQQVAAQTGGQVISTEDASEVLGFMQKAMTADGDMIRADSVTSQVLSGLMLLFEGLVIGLGMTLMLSLSGQKRVQIVLSPLMGIAAFILLKVANLGDVSWMTEAIALSLLGVVFMRSNRGGAHRAPAGRAPAAPVRTAAASSEDYSDDF